MRALIAVFALTAALLPASLVIAESVEFTVVHMEYEGSELWLPSTLVVHKGDHARVKLINNAKAGPDQHGFKIAAVNVETVVTRGEPKTVEFTADKDGVFPISCQLHPTHIEGQLVVLP